MTIYIIKDNSDYGFIRESFAKIELIIMAKYFCTKLMNNLLIILYNRMNDPLVDDQK